MSFGIPVRNGLGVGLLASTFLSSLRIGGRPAMSLDFIGTNSLDSRVTFTRASTATFVGSNGLIQSAAINAPRFDYDPVTFAPKGLLFEEQRINLLTYSEQFNNVIWLKPTGTMTSNTVVAPDGTQTADSYSPNTGTINDNVFQNVASLTIGGAYILSLYLKDTGVGSGWVEVTTTNPVVRSWFDIRNGVKGGGVGAIQAAGNGWYRCSVPTTLNNITTQCYISLRAANNDAGTIVVPSSVPYYNIWGAQFEAGAFVTSYIPTVASTVTRNRDVALMTGANFSSWYNQSEGTFFVDCSMLALSTTQSQELLSLNDGISTNAITVGANNAAGLSFSSATTASVSQGSISIAGAAAGVPQKIAHGIKLNDAALVRNGGAVSTDVTYTVPSGLTLMAIGCRSSGFAQLNGHIRQIAYYNTRLPNTTLQALTA